MNAIPEPILKFKNNQAELNKAFADYLHNRSVAIVGRTNLHQLEQGDLIDSHDVVVRVHEIVPYSPDYEFRPDNICDIYVPEEWRSRIGSRIDIFYHRVRANTALFKDSHDIDNSTIERVDQFWKQGGKFLCYEDPRPVPLRFAIPQRITDIRYVDLALYANLALEIGTDSVVSGIVVIGDILRHSVKSVYIAGFPCYFDAMIGQPEKWKKRQDIRQLEFLHRLSKHDRVAFDPLMYELFEAHCDRD